MQKLIVVAFAALCLTGASSLALAEEVMKGEMGNMKDEMKTENDAMKGDMMVNKEEMKSKTKEQEKTKGKTKEQGKAKGKSKDQKKTKGKSKEQKEKPKTKTQTHKDAAKAAPAAPAPCQPPLLLPRHKFSQSHQFIAWPSGGLAS